MRGSEEIINPDVRIFLFIVVVLLIIGLLKLIIHGIIKAEKRFRQKTGIREIPDKSIIITGLCDDKKAEKVKEIASLFKEDEVVFIEQLYDSRAMFLFSECTPKTKLIVFTKFPYIGYERNFREIIGRFIRINIQGREPFIISPKFVIVCNAQITQETMASMGERFLSMVHIINV